MSLVTASYVFSGLGDYFGGWGTEQGKSCLLYAHYDHCSTLRDIVDCAVDEFSMGYGSEELPEDVTEDDVRAAILDCLTDGGRADYESGALSEFAAEYAACNDLAPGVDIEDQVDDSDLFMYEESPVCIFLIECEICEECGALAEHAIDDICEGCAVKHGYEV